jgi:hypothetical protein
MGAIVSNPESREVFLNLLFETGVGGLREEGRWEDFVSGAGDIPMDVLQVDSLAVMELGIMVEDTYFVSLAPQEISRFPSLGALWDEIVARSHHS